MNALASAKENLNNVICMTDELLFPLGTFRVKVLLRNSPFSLWVSVNEETAKKLKKSLRALTKPVIATDVTETEIAATSPSIRVLGGAIRISSAKVRKTCPKGRFVCPSFMVDADFKNLTVSGRRVKTGFRGSSSDPCEIVGFPPHGVIAYYDERPSFRRKFYEPNIR